MRLRDKARLQLLEEIEELTKNGIYKLPAERSLCQKLNISRTTLRSALSELESEGKIIRHQGRSTFINKDFKNLKLNLYKMESYSELILNAGFKLKIKNLGASKDKIPGFVKKYGYYKKTEMIKSVRIFYADDKIAAVCFDYLPIDYLDNIEEISKYEDSIFKYLYEKYKISIEYGYMDFDVTYSSDLKEYLSKKEMKSLNPILLSLTGIEYDSDRNVIFYNQEFINTNIIEFSSIRKRGFHYE